ncbi:MAG TPA: hypothetical protein DDZ34_08480 [Syntrophaceae bacterium]|nr:hypothetical protein [Syntrophaceae bacterium]
MSDARLLYFAYGSNLNADDLRQWCLSEDCPNPLPRKGTPAFLPDAEPVFPLHLSRRGGGVLGWRKRVGHVLPGALFSVSETDLAVLDLKEGAPAVYRRETIEILLPDGSAVPAIAYNLPSARLNEHVPPDPGYLEVVAAGLKDYDHSVSQLMAATQRAEDAQGVPLFCYGTLMRGEALHGTMRSLGARFIGEADAPGMLTDLEAFPGFLPGGKRRVHGELFEFSDRGAALSLLDRLEGFRGYGQPHSLYRRVLIRVRTRTATLMAWVYAISHDSGVVIESGDWRRRQPVGPR